MRAVVKRAVERGLVASGAPAWGRRRRAGDALILAYHNVVPDDAPPAGDPSLHLPRRAFVAQVEALAQGHEVVPLPELLARRGGRGRPLAAITFDDAYRGAVEVGLPELARRGLPATVFVAGAMAGGGSFWWDTLALGQGGVLPEQIRHHALEALAGDDAAVRGWARAQGHPTAPPPWFATVAAADALGAALAAGPVCLAPHSWSHPNLARVGPDRLHDELAAGLAWLRERFEGVLPLLAYPYGRFGPAVEAAARAAGYQHGFAIEGGWLSAAGSGFTLPRWNVPAGISLDGFLIATAGLR